MMIITVGIAQCFLIIHEIMAMNLRNVTLSNYQPKLILPFTASESIVRPTIFTNQVECWPLEGDYSAVAFR